MVTEALQKKLANVELELQKTQKALAPSPKASLAFSFEPFNNPPAGSGASAVPATETRLPVLPDGTVHIVFTVINLTDIDAVDGELTVVICDDCNFAKEPAGFRKLVGQPDRQRNMRFQRIFARTSLQNITLHLVVPPMVTRIEIGILYRCRTCVLADRPSRGIVHLLR